MPIGFCHGAKNIGRAASIAFSDHRPSARFSKWPDTYANMIRPLTKRIFRIKLDRIVRTLRLINDQTLAATVGAVPPAR